MEPPLSRPPRRWRRRIARATDVAVIAAALAALGLWCSVPDSSRLAAENPSSTAFIELRRATAADAGKPFTLRWQWRPLGAISRYLRAAVVFAEDPKFYQHDGLDWDAIEHAVSVDWTRRTMSVGASTITQQLAKNLYLSPRRSLIRKARELLITFALEDHLSKQRILELYLNVVEWGDGVFGAEAAARTWFHHSAQALSPAEAVRLAVALPNPITRAPNLRDAELTRRRVRAIRLLRTQGLIDAAQERAALDDVGAPDERVLPDRAVDAPVAPPPAATAAPAAPATSPAAPGAPPPAPDTTGEPRRAEPPPAGGPVTSPADTPSPAPGPPVPPPAEPETRPAPPAPGPAPADAGS